MKGRLSFDRKVLVPWANAHQKGHFSVARTAAIGLQRDDGGICAAVLFDNYRPGASLCIHVCAEGRNWLNRDLLWAVFYFPFCELKVKKLIGIVESDNAAARKFDENLGFTLEATLKDAAPNGDILLYTMTADQCRFIREPRYGKVCPLSA